MLTEIPQLPPMLPLPAEIRPHTGEDYSDYLKNSVFLRDNNGFLRAVEQSFVTSSIKNAVFLSFVSDTYDPDGDDAYRLTHADIRNDIDKICFNLRLSKSALSEILSVSRQTIYDWLAGKNENFKSENLLKVEWLSELSQYLNTDVRAGLWLRKDKKLSSGMTIKNALGDAKISPQDLAAEINKALNVDKDASQFVSKSQNAIGKDLSDKSVPYANNE